MTASAYEQRNAYKGMPPRSWNRLRLRATDGTVEGVELLADTGSPCTLIISPARMARFKRAGAADIHSNFGPLAGGWLRLTVPELGLDQFLVGYASDAVVTAVEPR